MEPIWWVYPGVWVVGVAWALWLARRWKRGDAAREGVIPREEALHWHDSMAGSLSHRHDGPAEHDHSYRRIINAKPTFADGFTLTVRDRDGTVIYTTDPLMDVDPPDGGIFVAGDYLTVDIEQVGTADSNEPQQPAP